MSDEKFEQAMEKIQSFYFGDTEDSGEAMFEKFASKHAEKFKVAPEDFEDAEHKLEYTEVYKEFQKIFEEKIESLIKDSGVDQEEFVKHMAEKSKTDQDVKLFLDVLVSVSDYPNFLEMMVEQVEQKGL